MINQSTPTINHFSATVKLEKLSDSLEFIDDLGTGIINGLGLNVVKKVDNKFEPIGRTLIYLLSESHLAIHTWPEYNTLHIDLLSCKDIKKTDIDRVITDLLKGLKVQDFRSESHEV